MTSTSVSPAAASSAGRSGSSPGRAVERVLDDVVGDVGLLQPARHELEQLGQHDLRGGARDAHREPDHPASTRLSLASMPSSERVLSSVIVSAKRSSRSFCGAREPARGRDVDDDADVARAAARERRQPAPAQQDLLAGLGARGDLDRHRAVEGRDLDRGAERRQRRGDVDDGDQVLAVAQEALVLAHPHDDVEVAGRAAVLARVAAAREPDALAVGDARRDVDRDAALLARRAPRRRTRGRASRGRARRRRRRRRSRCARAGRRPCAPRAGAGRCRRSRGR